MSLTSPNGFIHYIRYLHELSSLSPLFLVNLPNRKTGDKICMVDLENKGKRGHKCLGPLEMSLENAPLNTCPAKKNNIPLFLNLRNTKSI
jgi:hypothetical protein